MSDAIIRMEEKLTFLEHHVEQLDGVVQDLAKQLAACQKSLAAMQDQQTQLREQLAGDAPAAEDEASVEEKLKSERPPHW